MLLPSDRLPAAKRAKSSFGLVSSTGKERVNGGCALASVRLENKVQQTVFRGKPVTIGPDPARRIVGCFLTRHT